MIKRHGLIVSEYPLDTPSLSHQFVERNRIIAGLSQACLIVEARKKSGSLYVTVYCIRLLDKLKSNTTRSWSQ